MRLLRLLERPIAAGVSRLRRVQAWLRPLPYRDADRVVVLWESFAARGGRADNTANPGNVEAWAARSETLANVAATVFGNQAQLVTVDSEPEEVMVRLTTANFFDVLGLDAALGRTFSAGAGGREGEEILLTDHYWREAFGADPNVIGRTFSLSSGVTGAIVGVLPPEWVLWGDAADVYATYTMRGGYETGRFLNTIARLAPGYTVEQAREEMETIVAGLREEHPDFNANVGVTVRPLAVEAFGEVDTLLWVMLGAVALLLLIACANVSNLFLARATARRREMAVRSSLGAERGTLVGQLLVESGLVAALGAAMGVAVASLVTRVVATRLPHAFALPRVEGASVDGHALLFALAVTVGTALLFGLVPAFHASQAQPGEALSAEARGAGRATGRARSALVVTEVALSMLLLVGAGLLGRSLISLLSEDLGIEPRNVLTARVTLATPPYRDPQRRAAFVEELSGRVAALPGVDAAGMTPFLPLDGLGSATGYWPGDRPRPAAADVDGTNVRPVTSGYFDALGTRLLAGRVFDRRDAVDGPRTVVISRALADEAWPGEDPLGRPLVLEWGEPEPVYTVVGVVGDVRLVDVADDPQPTAYFNVAQLPDFGSYHIAVRSDRPADDLRRAVDAELRAVDPALALGGVRVMEEIVGGSTARPRLTALLMGAFAAIAAVLAAVGLYGVLSYAVTQRVREIGLRVALGARPGEVLARVVGQGMVLVGVGLAIGLCTALLATRLLASLLYGIEPTDPVAITAAAGFLAIVALVACALPAWRATRVDPAEALRVE